MTARAQPWSSRGLNVCTLFVVGAFLSIYSTAAFGVVLDELELSVPGVLHFAVLSVLTGLALLAYGSCVFLDAGPVPPHWTPDTESLSQVLEVKRKGKGTAARHCNKCACYKPPRAHHCRVCNRCVLRMDHHCMWINNCVGHHNYKAFCLFLVYTCTALVHAILLIGGVVSHSHSVAGDAASHLQRAAQPPPPPLDADSSVLMWSLWRGFTLLGASLLLIALGGLLAWHVYLSAQNKTTIEYHEGVRARTVGQARADTDATHHPYDLGLAGNLQSVLGSFPGTWLLPLPAAMSGDGLTYEVADAARANLHGMGLPSSVSLERLASPAPTEALPSPVPATAAAAAPPLPPRPARPGDAEGGRSEAAEAVEAPLPTKGLSVVGTTGKGARRTAPPPDARVPEPSLP